MSGLEIVGTVASIAQLATTVYVISKALYEFSDALSNAPSDIKDLARDLETFSQELNLLSKLFENKNSRYSDEVHRLMAKIIGDCATICVKIDKILRKLRSGSVMARIKWVFKEKEIMKLLARLRDLKLSLLHALSMSHTFQADAMIDALRVHNPSLLEGSKNETASKETMEVVEEARRKLAGISVGQDSETLNKTPSLASQNSWESCGSNKSDLTDGSMHTSVSAESSSSKVESLTTSSRGAASKSPGIRTSSTTPFISTMTTSGTVYVLQNRQAMDSVQSFHSAVSHIEPDVCEMQELPRGNFGTIKVKNVPLSHQAESSVFTQSRMSLYAEYHTGWRAYMVTSAMKRFNISRSSAEEWVSSLPQPATSNSDGRAFGPTNGAYNEIATPNSMISQSFENPITCTNCFTQTTPLWRQDLEGHLLCNACGLFLKLHGISRPLSLRADVIKKTARGSSTPVATGGSHGAIENMKLPSRTQLMQLWWRAFTRLQDRDVSATKQLETAWKEFLPSCRSPGTSIKQLPSDEDVATFNIQHLVLALNDLENNVIPNSKPCEASKVPQSVTTIRENNVIPYQKPCEASVVSQSVTIIQEIINVVQQTLNFKIGALAWVCFRRAVRICTYPNMKEYLNIVFPQLADIVTLVARYNVMESIYQQWPNLTLERNYEESLVELCMHILRYLNVVMSARPATLINKNENLEQTLAGLVRSIDEADKRCRGFSVTIIENTVSRDAKRRLADVEDSSEDSDDTLVEEESEKEGVDNLSRTKKIKM